MNDWKELKKDNLPSDILTGDYEFEFRQSNGSWELSYVNIINIIGIIDSIANDSHQYRYRKVIKNFTLTNDQIASRWWRTGNMWYKVKTYCSSDNTFYIDKKWHNIKQLSEMRNVESLGEINNEKNNKI